jgi:hypothetical protein
MAARLSFIPSFSIGLLLMILISLETKSISAVPGENQGQL